MNESCDFKQLKRGIVTNLYLIVLGRSPDPGGLASYTNGAGDSPWIESVAASLLASDEFRDKRGVQGPVEMLCLHGLGRSPSNAERQLTLVDLTTSLLQRRAKVYPLAADYPEGIRLTDVAAYNRWLASERERWAATLPAGLTSAEPILSVVLLPRTADWALLGASLCP